MKDLSHPSKLERTPATKAKPAGKVDRTGGDYGAGFIPGVSLITQGEALGHDAWIDEVFNQQVAEALNASREGNGVKSRFAHPSLSGDGTGTVLGRLKNARVEGEQVLADLHLLKSAHDAPDGNLANYVMNLAEEDSTVFGLSIVFGHDEEAEDGFLNEHSEEFEYTDRRGDKQKGKRFRSPDARNGNNYYHVRLKELQAGDVVDDPAANPEGLFYRGQDLPAGADKVLAFALGLAEEKPASLFGVDSDRVKGFATRFLAAHGLEIKPKEKTPMSTANPTAEGKPVDHKAELLSQMSVYTGSFGAEQGLAWFQEGKPLLDCWKETATKARTDLAEAQKEITTLKTQIAGLRGEASPLSSNPAPVASTGKTISRIAAPSQN